MTRQNQQEMWQVARLLCYENDHLSEIMYPANNRHSIGWERDGGRGFEQTTAMRVPIAIISLRIWTHSRIWRGSVDFQCLEIATRATSSQWHKIPFLMLEKDKGIIDRRAISGEASTSEIHITLYERKTFCQNVEIRQHPHQIWRKGSSLSPHLQHISGKEGNIQCKSTGGLY